MLDNIGEMEKTCLDSETKGLTAEDFKKLQELNNRVHDIFIKYYTIQEDILFPELEKVLPSPTSTTSMRNEHREIITINNRVNGLLDKESITGTDNKDILASVYSLSDMVQRHFHKKNNVMYHEVSSFISEAVQGEIYLKILQKQKTADS